MDPWLRQHLADIGAMTESGLTRKAQPRRCRKCNEVVIVGLDDDVCAAETYADPTPLSTLGEVVTLLEGRRTVALASEGGRRVLHIRDDFQIRGRPAGSTPRWDVLRAHRCGSPPLPEALTAPTSFPSATADRLPPGSPAPF